MDIPVTDDPAVENRKIFVVPTTKEVPGVIVVEKNRSRRRHLLIATITTHLVGGGGPDRGLRQGGLDATTDDPRDGSDRAGEIALMTDRDATIECTAVGATSDSRASRIAATMTKKLRVISRSSGASRSPDATQRRRRF